MINKTYFFIFLFVASTGISFLFISSFKHIENRQLSEKKSLTASVTEVPSEISLTAVGDISFSRGVERVIKSKNDINYPFANTIELLVAGDITFGNLETTISKGREIADGEMVFRSNPGSELAIKEAGFDIVSVANNHTPDFGEKGLADTLAYLDSAGIKHVGAGNNSREANEAAVLEIKGVKLAFLAFTDPSIVPDSYGAKENSGGTAFMDIQKLKQAINDAKSRADLVIVSMHSGTEYIFKPNDYQTEFARAAIDGGAEMVIGHHPHVVQSMEKYKEKYILYSLGNFIFDQMWSRETREGLIMKAVFTKDGVKNINFIPVVIENYSQPRPANKKESKSILDRLSA